MTTLRQHNIINLIALSNVTCTASSGLKVASFDNVKNWEQPDYIMDREKRITDFEILYYSFIS